MSADYLSFGFILAGGSGERFWPLSRAARPKQLLRLTHPDKNMIAEAAERLAPIIPRERLYVVTARHLVEPIRAADTGVPPENVIGEPDKRNTSGALAWAVATVLARHPDLRPEQIAMATVTADHRIGAPDTFRAMVRTALDAAHVSGALVTCGIPPTHPETGFGYIQAGEPAATPGVFRVRAFHEKPAREAARDFLDQGNYYWNSGMFFWSAAAFLGELGRVRPEMVRTIEAMRAAIAGNDDAAANAAFRELENISIDYALMEHARDVLMVRGEFPWADVGSWPALEAVHPPDAEGNCLSGDPVVVDSRDCIVYNDTGSKTAVAVLGASSLIVVVTDDAVLVVPKDRAQEIRQIVAELRRRGANQV